MSNFTDPIAGFSRPAGQTWPTWFGVWPLDLRLEKRISPRRNTMIAAHIVFDGGRKQIECVIRNLSDGGAKLEVASVRGIPDQFQLLVPQHRPQHCRVAWRSLREMGVQFLQSPAAG